ncbi:MAG: CPBP family intramembrane metalloprotease [Bacteroidales bacterium]|nr:CPBP family intramembrane metalloprotease [Bacteroidales bacterium]
MRRTSKSNFNLLGRHTYFVPNVPELLVLLLWFILGALLANIVNLVVSMLLGPEASKEVALMAAYPVMFIPPMLYASTKSRYRCLRRSGARLDSSNFGGGGAFVYILAAMAGTLALAFCADAASSLLPAMPQDLKDILDSMVSGNFLVNLLCVSIFAPFFEEWLCRGMVLRGLLGNNVKPFWAIFISALFFALIHLNPWQALPAFLLGALFGYVYYKTGSLKLTMLMHFTNNTFALVMSRIPEFKDMDTWRDVLPGREFFVILACCILITALVVLRFVRIELKSDKGNIDEVPALFEQ